MATVLVGTTEAAQILGITRAAVKKRVAVGTLKPHATIGPGNIAVFDRADIEALKEDKSA